MNPSDLLDQAAAVSERNGWNQGGLTTHAGPGPAAGAPCDVLGAIGIAAHGKPWHLKGTGAAVEALADYLGMPADVPALAAWNDAPGRTGQQVAAALRGAALAVKEAAQ